MKLNLKKKPNVSFRDHLSFFSRCAGLFFIVLFCVAFGAGLYDWYANVYKGDWTDEQKRQYAETAFQETLLKGDMFRVAVASVSNMATSHSTSVKVSNDLFLPLPSATAPTGP